MHRCSVCIKMDKYDRKTKLSFFERGALEGGPSSIKEDECSFSILPVNFRVGVIHMYDRKILRLSTSNREGLL